MRPKYLIIGAVLVAVIAAGWFSPETLETQSEAELVMENQSDFQMRGLHLYVSDGDGNAKYHLSARSLIHFPLADITRLEAPEVVVYHQREPAWIIDAEQGMLKNRAQLLELYQGVSLHKKAANSDSPVLLLESEALSIDLVKKEARSDSDVLLRQQGMGEIRGRGLLADLQNNRLQLQSQVRVIYEND